MIVTTHAGEEYTVCMDSIEYELFREWISLHRQSLEGVQHDAAAKPTFELLNQLDHELTFPRLR